MAKNKESKLIFNTFSGKQFFWFLLGVLFIGTGIALLILYYLGTYAPSRSGLKETLDAALTNFNTVTYTTIGFIGWGLICLILGACIIAGALSFASKLEDKEKDRKARRELRLEALKKSSASQEDIIDQVIESESK